MTGQMAAMMTGVVLAMSAATLPASASGLHINTQDLPGGEQQTQLLSTTGSGTYRQIWRIDERDAKLGWLTPRDRATYSKFKVGIVEGLSPLQSAKKLGITEDKSLSERYEERMYGQDVMYLNLSKKGFVALRIDRQAKIMKVLEVGTRQQPIPTSSYTQPVLQY
jgi:hypothetical protein